ncbi:MAG: hypothetical protein EBU90_05685 [Proteobacteria bacterium]|nr:hypothetical protein [Pseudomonadota bacterium]
MSYIKMIIMALTCVIFQDAIQATLPVRAGLSYVKRAGARNPNYFLNPIINKQRIGRLPIPEGVTLHPLDTVTTPTASSSSVVTTTEESSSAKKVIFSLLDQHKKILVDLAVVVASLNLDGVDLTDLLAIKDAFRNNPLLPTALSIKLQTIIAKQESLTLRSKFLRTQQSFNDAKTLK